MEAGGISQATEAGKDDPRLAVRYERWDNLTDEYVAAAAKIAGFQALAELVGALPFAEWIPRVPDYARKQMLIAKVQDEVGHGHVTARIAEDLGVSRESLLEDFAGGKSRLLNIFHFGFETWEEIGPAALLMNSAAIVQFQSLSRGTYLPYARALKKIEKEEGFHYHHALDLTHQVLVEGSPSQRQRVEEAFEVWFPRVLAYFGPPDNDTYRQRTAYRLGLKVDANDTLRQRWIAKIVPVVEGLGGPVPTGLAHFDETLGRWGHLDIDWAGVRNLIDQGGPKYREWVEHIRSSLERNRPYREAALAA